MSTSLLYHGFGLQGCRYVKTDYRFGETRFTVQLSRLVRPSCGVRDLNDLFLKLRQESLHTGPPK
jgi:hypothetical protein